jgi:hypothetical protein
VSVRAALLIDRNCESGSKRPGVGKEGHDRFEVRRPSEGRHESKRIRRDNSDTFIHFGGGVKMNTQTSSTNNTRCWMFGLIFIENAYHRVRVTTNFADKM